jgi:hypothetical protein
MTILRWIVTQIGWVVGTVKTWFGIYGPVKNPSSLPETKLVELPPEANH